MDCGQLAPPLDLDWYRKATADGMQALRSSTAAPSPLARGAMLPPQD
jgi:hypothetical protein